MKKATSYLVILTAIAALALTACGGSGASLAGTSWTLTDLNGSAPLAGTTVTLQFADGQVSGQSGCNQFGGSYDANGDKLTVSALFMTEMACLDPEGAMDQESAYLDLLGRAARYQNDGSQLVITTGSGQTLTFAASS